MNDANGTGKAEHERAAAALVAVADADPEPINPAEAPDDPELMAASVAEAIDAKPRPPRPPSTPFTRDGEGLQAALDNLKIQIRYNIREHRAEWRAEGVSNGEWFPSNDRWEAALQDTIADRFRVDIEGKIPLRFGALTWSRSTLACMFYAEVDPFAEYLQHCTWDGTARLAHWLKDVFECNPDDPLVAWVGAFIFLGPVWRTFEPGTDLHETPVLIGPQDSGKSSAVRWALPQTTEARRWFSEGINLAGDDQERVEALLGRVLVEASELAGSTRAELESLKAFLTRSDDGNVRLPYRRNTEMLLRTCCIVGTSNTRECLPADPSGNRRFVPIDVRAGEAGHAGVRVYLTVNRGQLWAEAVHLYREGVSARLPEALKVRQADVNAEHRRGDEMLEVRLDGWLYHAPALFEIADAALGCGLTDTAAAAVKMPRRDQHRLADALRLAGYEKARIRIAGDLVWRWRHAG